MFRFNFGTEDDGTPAPTAAPPAQTSSTPKRGAMMHNTIMFNLTDDQFINVSIDATTQSSMLIVNEQHPQFVANTGELAKILTTSDIQTGVYEGGFKLWEGAVDLIQYLMRHASSFPMASQADYRVMELGCGHGLPGIYALLQGAAEVYFSDYNKEVIELATIPNVLRNASPIVAAAKARYYSGDWQLVSDLMHTQGVPPLFDLILTAETIYTESVAITLAQTIVRHLKRGGVALVAAKTYYFGTGGSVHHFKQLIDDVRSTDGRRLLVAETVWDSNDARSNMREIVRVTYAD
ncbi:Aste57867_15473 [Aphanomyces stellatus]|uniref:protein-histidine N-methyltransferase n=1 Tax=Aphanomyces stellatus TaxID=120398 RepID=A0A485L4J9_9STRA|nr:hypothetical protein As57867_015417 [Aphanomyces stellatus]VFT92275.1 Aste57867_15473 [Aphanomyces stellatus]